MENDERADLVKDLYNKLKKKGGTVSVEVSLLFLLLSEIGEQLTEVKERLDALEAK